MFRLKLEEISELFKIHIFLLEPLLPIPLQVQKVMVVPDHTHTHAHAHARTHTHTHSVGLPWTSDRSVQKPVPTHHNKHERKTSVSSAEFEPAIPAMKRPRTNALNRTATGIGHLKCIPIK
jgi:hypothetical protein